MNSSEEERGYEGLCAAADQQAKADEWMVKHLARVLVGQDKPLYERLRKELIEKRGYDLFRELQSRAFEVALFGHEVTLDVLVIGPST